MATQPHRTVSDVDEKGSSHENVTDQAGNSVMHVTTMEEKLGLHYEEPPLTTKRLLAMLSLLLVFLGSQMPLYFIGATYSYLSAYFGSPKDFSWMTVSYSLSLAATCTFTGSLSDLMGRRNLNIIGCLLCLVGIAMVGGAPASNVHVAFGGMGILGVGAGITELTAVAGIAEIAPVKKRGLYVSIVLLSFLPVIPYVLYGQLIASKSPSSWKWVMWLNLILNFVALIGIVLFYHPPPRETAIGKTKSQILKEIDIVGAFLLIGGVALFLAALQAGGETQEWKSAKFIAMLIIGIVMIALYIPWAMRHPNPIIPPKLFANNPRVVSLSMLIIFVGGMNFYSVLSFLPLYPQVVFGAGPVRIGLDNLGSAAGTVIYNIISTCLVSWFPGQIREQLIFGTAAMTAGIGSLASIRPDSEHVFIGISVLIGIGIGSILWPTATIAMIATDSHFIATIAAVNLAFRLLGGAVGVTIYTAVFTSKLSTILPAEIAGAGLAAGLPASSLVPFVTGIATGNVTEALSAPGVTPAILGAGAEGARLGYALGLRWVFLTSIPFGVISVICAACIGSIKPYLSNKVAVDLH